MLLVVPQMTRAALIYNIQTIPYDQDGHTLSGTITTDGSIGTLIASDIKSWVVTFDNNYTIQSTDSGIMPINGGQPSLLHVDHTEVSEGYLGLFTAEVGLELHYDSIIHWH